MSVSKEVKKEIGGEYPPWHELPTEILELMAAPLSWVDHQRFTAVCKSWRSIPSPTDAKKRWPFLLQFFNHDGRCELVDPFDGTVRTIEIEELSSNVQLTKLRFSKDGWLLASHGRHLTAVNPFTGETVDFPEAPLMSIFQGLSFSSPPNDEKSIVMCIGSFSSECVSIVHWRHSQHSIWTMQHIDNSIPFIVAENNPIFHNNLFYCLGRNGNIGIFDPEGMSWTVLPQPKPIRAINPDLLHSYKSPELCYLVKSNGKLFSVYDSNIGKPLIVFMLDEVKMVWRKVEDLGNQMFFLNIRASLSFPSPREGFGNRVYFPAFALQGDSRLVQYYSFGSRRYYPEFYGVHHPIQCVWIEKPFTR